MKTLLKDLQKGLIIGVGFLLTLGLASISYAAFTGFAGLDATTGEALTETKWDNLVDAVRDDYSTSETRTSKTWLGKPVYRKVLSSIVNADNDGTISVLVHTDVESMRIENIFIHIPAWNTTVTTAWQPGIYHVGGSTDDSTKKVHVYSNHSTVVGKTAQIVVEYTKTTD